MDAEHVRRHDTKGPIAFASHHCRVHNDHDSELAGDRAGFVNIKAGARQVRDGSVHTTRHRDWIHARLTAVSMKDVKHVDNEAFFN